jgi:hypothetical protein
MNIEWRQQRDEDAEGAPSSQSAPRATLPDETDPVPPYTPHASQPHVARPSLLPIHVSTVIAQALANEGVLSGSTPASSTSASTASSTFSASSSSGGQQSQLYSRRAERARLHRNQVPPTTTSSLRCPDLYRPEYPENWTPPPRQNPPVTCHQSCSLSPAQRPSRQPSPPALRRPRSPSPLLRPPLLSSHR